MDPVVRTVSGKAFGESPAAPADDTATRFGRPTANFHSSAQLALEPSHVSTTSNNANPTSMGSHLR